MSEFARLVRIIYSDLSGRETALDKVFSKGREPRLELVVTMEHMSLGIGLGENGEDFIPDVARHTAQLSSGGNRALDDLAADLMDDLVMRALRVGRVPSERR